MEVVKEGRSRITILGLFSFLGLNIADSIITWQGLSMGALEVNWYNFLLGTIPVWAVLAVKMIIVGLIAFLIYKYKKSLFKFLNIGMTLIVVFNLFSLIITRIAR